MGHESSKNLVKLWKSRTIAGLELKRATLRNFAFGRHMDERFVVCLVQDGVEHFACRGSRYAAAPGDIVLYQPEDVHDGSSPDQKPWSYRCFYAAEPLVRGIVSGAATGGPAPSFPDKVIRDRPLAAQWSALHRRMEAGENALRDQAAFLRLLADLVDRHAQRRGATTPAPGGVDRGRLLRSRDFLEAHSDAPVTLDQLAALAGLSPFHFLREFKRFFGMPPHQYQKQVQVRRAKDLLERGVPIAAAAVEAGFFDQSHLNRVFKSFTGLTPGQFRS
jgi:AraC-like DNA-binding protein